MFKKFALAAIAASTTLTALPAAAEARSSGRHYSNGYYEQSYRPNTYYGRGSSDAYYRNGYYRNGGRYYRNGSSGYGYGYDHRCHDSGTTGTILGAVAGGLLGREIDRSDSRYGHDSGTTGLIIGGALGALAGRAIDRDC
jgi:hypothetical protein